MFMRSLHTIISGTSSSALKYEVNYIVHGILTQDPLLLHKIKDSSDGERLLQECIAFTRLMNASAVTDIGSGFTKTLAIMQNGVAPIVENKPLYTPYYEMREN